MPASVNTCIVDPANTHYALPEGLIIDFEPRLPSDLNQFQGIWCGTWGGYIPQVLVIDRVRSDGQARFLYAWGDSIHGVKDNREGQINLCEKPLRIQFPRGVVEFELVANGDLFGVYKEGREFQNCITLSKILDTEGDDAIAVEHLRLPAATGVDVLDDSTLSLYCTVYRNTRRKNAPLLLLNHGSAGGRLGPVVTYLYDAQARYFVNRGFAVVVPMRSGRGKSDGPFLETANEDTAASTETELSAGVSDVFSVLDYLHRKDWISAQPCMLAGQSRGGFLSLVCAAQAPSRICAVVNFSGGWWHEKSDAASYQLQKLKSLGAELKLPTIWLYGDNDYFYGSRHICEMHGAYTCNGGIGDLHIFKSHGHDLIERMHVWQERVDSFIRALGINGVGDY